MSCYCGKQDCPKCNMTGHPSYQPGPGPAITVDVEKWLKERHNPGGGLKYPPEQAPRTASPADKERVRQTQEELRERWQEREELAEREHLLDNEPRECVECSATRQHYKNDYICYRCRDAAGGPA